MDFDIQGARKAGYSDDEIAAYLSKQKNFDKTAAEKAGYSPKEIIDHLSPTSTGQQVADGTKELFGRDPSKAGQLTGSDYASRALAGAATGGAIGGAIGAVTGPGAIVTGTAGAISGATSGLIEAFLEDQGYGAGTQFVGGMLAPGAGIGTKIGQFIESKIVDKALSYGAKKATGIPVAGSLVQKGKEFLESKRPVDVEEVSKTLKEKASTLGVGNTKNIDDVTDKLSKQHPNVAKQQGQSVSNALYEEAKTAADKTAFPTRGGLGGEHFSATNEFDSLHKGIASEKEAYGKLFLDEKGNPLVGDKIITNLHYKEGIPISDLTKARKSFNDYLERTTGKRGEEIARKAYEQEQIALAKDTLPSLFERGSASEVKKQLQNLGKNKESVKVFKQEFLNYLENTNAQNAKAMWGQIGSDVKKYVIKDPDVYQRVSDIMNGAKTQKEISRAVRLIMRAATPFAISAEKNL